MLNMATTRNDLIKVLFNMNYGTLKGISQEFASMIDKDVRPKIETPEEFAELLFDWAEAQNEQ
jgi:hypothetical protein